VAAEEAAVEVREEAEEAAAEPEEVRIHT